MTILDVEKKLMTNVRFDLVYYGIKDSFSWSKKSIKQLYYGYDVWEDDDSGFNDTQLYRLGFNVDKGIKHDNRF